MYAVDVLAVMSIEEAPIGGHHRRGRSTQQHYEATRLAYKNALLFLQEQLLPDCSLKRFSVFSKANLETLK